MRRWWVDPGDARTVLASVNDSDPGAGVSTAFLGLHALQREALAALGSSTLVDGSVVDAHLRAVDVEPVAKAVATATRTVMGDAAEAYGQLLARDMQEQSREAAQDVLLRWTQQGMPWPTAVQRLSSIVGVPTRSLGRTVETLRGPVTDLVAGDYGDRALMMHAQRLASWQPDLVTKSLNPSELAMFNREHRRDERGRFAEKPDSPGTSRQGRLERRARRDRKQRRRDRRAAEWQAEAAARQRTLEQAQRSTGRSFLGGLFDRIESARPVAAEQSRTDPRLNTRRGDPRLNARRLRPVAATRQDSLLPKVKATNAVRLDGKAYAIVDRSVMDAMVVDMQAEKFNIQGFSQMLGSSGVTVYDYDTVREALEGGYLPGDVKDPLVVEFNTLAVTDDDGLHSFELAADAEYEFYDTFSRPSPGKRAEYEVVNSPWRTPSAGGSPAATKKPMRLVEQVSVVLSNENAFQRQGRDLPYDRQSTVGRVNRMGEIEFDKNLSGSELHAFNQEHPRDEEGRFTDKPRDPAADRRARRDRRRRRTQRRWQEYQDAQQQAQQAQQAASGPSALDSLLQSAPQRQQKTVTDPRVGRRDPRLEQGEQRRREYRAKLQQEYRQRAAVAYGSRTDAKKYDFASAGALLLDDIEFTDLAGLDPDGVPLEADMAGEWDDPLGYIVDQSRVPGGGAEALHKIVSGALVSRQRTSTRPLPAQEEYRGYDTEAEALQAALEYIAEWQMDEATTMSWDAAVSVEPHRETRRPMYFPKRVGYELDEAKVLVFGSDMALDDMRTAVEAHRLERIPAETLSELLALRASDDSLKSLDVSDTIPNPAVRAYWYHDEG